MNRFILLLLLYGARALTLNLDYLDPTKLQTIVTSRDQELAANLIINHYSQHLRVVVKVTHEFSDHKDMFSIDTSEGQLHITASTGVAALWGFNYYLKKYCKSQIAWQVRHLSIPDPLPEAHETVVANDRFRYYQNVCTVSYSFVWWRTPDWYDHVHWMAFNGINLALVPVAQEAAWLSVFRSIGMTEGEINEHFTGPAFVSWLRMGNVHGWGGPMDNMWHTYQRELQLSITNFMFQLGVVPILPAFNGHVPKAFERIYPNSTFYSVEKWNKFDKDYCCGIFLDPTDPLFKIIGKMFLEKVTKFNNILGSTGHIYTADPFNEVNITPWSTSLVQNTAKAIQETLSEFDDKSVWLVQNWMFVKDPVMWPLSRVKTFLTSVPNGRMLVLDLQAEQWPQYNLYDMYYGQPFIWCMLHNFGGTLGMFGNVVTINKDVYEARLQASSTMIGIGLTPEGINQNYVVYDLMLEAAWRKRPIEDMETWAREYAARRYGCNAMAEAWRFLLKSVYSFDGLNMMRGKYVVTRRPSLRIKPWAWYKSHDLFKAFEEFVYTTDPKCDGGSFIYDLVDVTRQALQYRAEQLYLKLLKDRFSSSSVLNSTITQFLDVMADMSLILAESEHFSAIPWFKSALEFALTDKQASVYTLNSRNQITLWGPNGEITDYACKQWAEIFHYYYIPRWSSFLSSVLDAKLKHKSFDERAAQSIVRSTVEEKFLNVTINKLTPIDNVRDLGRKLFAKWGNMPELEDLPLDVIRPADGRVTTLADVDISEETAEPTVVMVKRSTPTFNYAKTALDPDLNIDIQSSQTSKPLQWR